MVSLQTVGQLGENESLRRTVSRLSAGEHTIVGSGDDAAVVATTDDRFVVTTDTMIEGHDFRLDWSSFYDLGFKAVATNLSDVAAMGATPTALVVAISVPVTTLIENLEAFADGLRDACQQLAPGCGVVGGDLASSEQVFISVTAHGALQGREPVLRSGAKSGEVIAFAGTLGRAAAGRSHQRSSAVSRSATGAWQNRQHRRPNAQRPAQGRPCGVTAGARGWPSERSASLCTGAEAARLPAWERRGPHVSLAAEARRSSVGWTQPMNPPA